MQIKLRNFYISRERAEPILVNRGGRKKEWYECKESAGEARQVVTAYAASHKKSAAKLRFMKG